MALCASAGEMTSAITSQPYACARSGTQRGLPSAVVTISGPVALDQLHLSVEAIEAATRDNSPTLSDQTHRVVLPPPWDKAIEGNRSTTPSEYQLP